jgi:protein-tyrosine phosphatase
MERFWSGALGSRFVRTIVAYVDIDTQTDGSQLVRWQLEGEPVAVDIATGPTPDHLDHQHHSTVNAGRTALQLPGGPVRRYVSVAPHDGGPAVVAADRRIPFEGISNFRDLGGYRTTSGRAVRWGLVFRADALHGLSTNDLALYEGLGLRAVYDLRGEIERTERPNPVPSRPLTVIGRPTDAGTPAAPPSIATTEEGERFLYDLYIGLIEHAAIQIGELYQALAQDDGLPAVFHCHAGKDRTGLVAAVLLEALGVQREAVLDDYELTARYRVRAQQEPTFQRLIEYGMSPEAAAGVLTTPRWAMQDALAEVDRKYGGVEAYLTGPAGMQSRDLLTLRECLLDGAA